MRVPELADVLRGAGLAVVETPGWQTRDHGPLSGVKTIVCHHTAGPATGEYPSLAVVRDGRPGLAGPLAQLGLGRSGTWYCISAGKAWHAGEVLKSDYGNDWSIGIEAEATGRGGVDTDWPDVQMQSYAAGCRALIDHYGLDSARVLGHKEVCSPPGRKSDPNFDMPGFRRRIAALTPGEVMPALDSADLAAIKKVVVEAVFTSSFGKDADGTPREYQEMFATLYSGVNTLLTRPAPAPVDVQALATALAAKLPTVDVAALATALAAQLPTAPAPGGSGDGVNGAEVRMIVEELLNRARLTTAPPAG